MADPLSKLNKMVNKQKTIISTLKKVSENLSGQKSTIRQDEKVQPTPTIEPPPNGSPSGDV